MSKNILKIKKNGQAALGGILMIVLLIALVVFIFSLIRRPGEEPPPPPPLPPEEFTGLTEDALKEAKAGIEDIEQEFPISQVLPYGGPFYGEPFAIHNPSPDGTILIEAESEEAKEEALDWIAAQGYNPGNYNIQFKISPFTD